MGKMDNKYNMRLTALMAVWLLAGAVYSGVDDEFEMEPLRDPFWPVGYFPEAWNEDSAAPAVVQVETKSDWAAVEKMIRITGTALLDGKTAAIVNDLIKEEGDVVELVHKDRVYRWKVKEVGSNGTVRLDRLEVTNRSRGFQSGDRK